MALGLSLSLFFAIFYVICIIGYLVFPGLPKARGVWHLPARLRTLELVDILPRLVESFIWGWYIALIFAPLFNFFSRHFR